MRTKIQFLSLRKISSVKYQTFVLVPIFQEQWGARYKLIPPHEYWLVRWNTGWCIHFVYPNTSQCTCNIFQFWNMSRWLITFVALIDFYTVVFVVRVDKQISWHLHMVMLFFVNRDRRVCFCVIKLFVVYVSYQDPKAIDRISSILFTTKIICVNSQ